MAASHRVLYVKDLLRLHHSQPEVGPTAYTTSEEKNKGLASALDWAVNDQGWNIVSFGYDRDGDLTTIIFTKED